MVEAGGSDAYDQAGCVGWMRDSARAELERVYKAPGGGDGVAIAYSAVVAAVVRGAGRWG